MRFSWIAAVEFSVFSSEGLWMQWCKVNSSKMPLFYVGIYIPKTSKESHCLQCNVFIHLRSQPLQPHSLPNLIRVIIIFCPLPAALLTSAQTP